jgi:ATP-binding cassette subfamily B protein
MVAQTAQQTVGAELGDRQLMRMLIRFISPYWRRMLAVLVMLFAVTGLSLLPPYLIQRAVDGPIHDGKLSELTPYGVLYFGTILTIFILQFAYTYGLQTIGQNALAVIRQVLFEHILKQDMAYFNTTPVGQLVSRLSNDVDALSELLSTSIVLVASSLITLVGIIVVMMLLNWRLAILGLAVLPVMFAATLYFRNRIRIASAAWHKIVGDYLAFLNEQFGGMLIIQLFGRQAISQGDFEKVSGQYRDNRLLVRDKYTVYAAVLQLLTAVGLALILYGGGSGVLAGWATLGMLIAFIQYTQRSFEPVLNLSEQFAQIQTALAAGERVAQMLTIEPTIREPEQPATIRDFKGAIQFDHITFAYEAGTPVLRDIALSIPPGQSVAIVGATGAGKSSLVGLLARFYDVNQGCILLDGIDLRAYSFADLRQYIVVVPQNPYCFTGTIEDNLRLFNPAITRDQIEAASHTARAAPFIESLPGKYAYKLLPGGANLSQGQRQLLALARALIHSPHGILVLDEATSSIDTETEALIQEGLHSVLHGRTSIVIAHRLSTVREVDRIVVMRHGQIVEEGSHAHLLAQDGLYAQLYKRQFAD